MTRTAGTRLGPYEILSPLGAGGMGEVYRARDTRIGRLVALKVLPESLFASAERRSRFESEARLLASLSHPGIAVLYSFEEIPGSPGHVLVMELLEGETLRAELAGGRFPTRKAVDYAIQIAEGLAAAHARGVVHRDLKPENLFVTKEGRVKILDFGLAKAVQPDGSVSISSLPTDTEPGVVMGTLGYFSPEQVKGQPADERSDIFALGVVLHEMLSGERPFRGASAAETMAAILREDPPELSATNRSVSPGLERLVRHCLEKSPEQRFQSARDLAYDLRSLSTDSSVALPPSVPATTRKGRRAAVGGAALLAVALLAAWGLRAIRSRPLDPEYRRLTFRRGTVYGARFAPDGRTVVYSAAWEGQPARIFATNVGSVESRTLQLPDARILSVSSSGELAILIGRQAIWTPPGTLARVPLEGGAPREILEHVTAADWTPDGRDLAVVHKVGGKDRLEFPIGKVLYETSSVISSVRFSPKGDRLALSVDPDGVLAVDLSGKVSSLAKIRSWVVAWSPSGSEIWFAGVKQGEKYALFAVDLSGHERLVRHETGGIFLHDISKEGRVLLNEYFWYSSLVGFSAGESTERELSWMDQPLVTAITGDGRSVVFDEWGEGAGDNGAIYLRAMDGSPAVRLGDGHSLALSPDARWVLSSGPPKSETFVLYPTGAGQPKTLPHPGIVAARLARVFPDGRKVLFAGRAGSGGWRFYVQDLEGGAPRPLSPEGLGVDGAAMSPDGRSVAAQGPNSTIAIYPLDGAPPRPLSGAESGEIPILWSLDGRSLYAFHNGKAPAEVLKIDVATGRRELWKTLAPADRSGLVAIDNVVITPDTRSYAYDYQRILTSLQVVDGLR